MAAPARPPASSPRPSLQAGDAAVAWKAVGAGRSEGRRPARAFAAAYAAGGAALVALCLAAPQLYLVDLPAWTYTGAVVVAEAGGATPWGLYPWPVPNTWATLGAAPLVAAFGPLGAGRAFGAGLLAAGFGAAWALAAAVDVETAPARAAVLASTLVVSSSWWNGYLGFQIGVTLTMALGARWVRRGGLSPAGLAAGSTALFFAHAVPFAAFALGAGLDALRRRDGRALAALVPAGALTTWYLAARLSTPDGGFVAPQAAGGAVRAVAYKAYTAVKLGPFQHPDGLDGTGVLHAHPALYWAGVALSALFVAVLAGVLAVGTVRLWRGRGAGRGAAAYGWALVAVALALPPFALNVVNPGERVLVMAAVVLVAAVPVPRRVLAVLGGAALLFLADDAHALWAQRSGLDADRRAELLAPRERPARPFGDAVEAAAAEPLPLLGHPVLLNARYYGLAERADWTAPAFDSGPLRPPEGGRGTGQEARAQPPSSAPPGP